MKINKYIQLKEDRIYFNPIIAFTDNTFKTDTEYRKRTTDKTKVYKLTEILKIFMKIIKTMYYI